MKVWLPAFLFLFSLVSVSVAEARFGREAYLVDFSLYYNSVGTTSTTTASSMTSEGTQTIYDINAGKVSEKGFYYGAIYTGRSRAYAGQAPGKGGSAMGLSAGLFSENGYYVMAHYLLTASNDGYVSGSGYQGEVGFKYTITGNWLLGANFSYRSMTYKKVEPENPSFVSEESTEILPMISLGFLF